jgi:hypothetical protein
MPVVMIIYAPFSASFIPYFFSKLPTIRILRHNPD